MRPNPLIATFTAIVRFQFNLVPVKTAHVTRERPAVNEESNLNFPVCWQNFEKCSPFFANCQLSGGFTYYAASVILNGLVGSALGILLLNASGTGPVSGLLIRFHIPRITQAIPEKIQRQQRHDHQSRGKDEQPPVDADGIDLARSFGN